MVFSSFMLYNEQTNKAAITAIPSVNNEKSDDNGIQRLDNIKYLSERVSEVVSAKDIEKY